MKNFIRIALVMSVLATMVMAQTAKANVTVPNPYTNVPQWIQDYFSAMDIWLIGIFWKYIMYGTWYVLFDQIYCEFLTKTLDSVLSGISPLLKNALDDATSKKECHAAFW